MPLVLLHIDTLLMSYITICYTFNTCSVKTKLLMHVISPDGSLESQRQQE